MVSHPELVGMWFDTDPAAALGYLKKAIKTPGRNPSRAFGARLVVAEVPTDRLDELKALNHPVAKTMDVEPGNHIVPRDGSIPTIEIPLDEMVTSLGGTSMGFRGQSAAKTYIDDILGKMNIKN